MLQGKINISPYSVCFVQVEEQLEQFLHPIGKQTVERLSLKKIKQERGNRDRLTVKLFKGYPFHKYAKLSH